MSQYKPNRPCFCGTYSFCEKCPQSGVCCKKVSEGGRIERPIVFKKETKIISDYLKMTPDSFSEKSTLSGDSRWVSANKKGCLFYQNKKCAIYPVRPLDCRLFPWDIYCENGKLVLIVYRALCPVEFNPYEYLGHVRNLIVRFGNKLRSYSQFETPGMDNERHLVVGYLEDVFDNMEKHQILNSPAEFFSACKEA